MIPPKINILYDSRNYSIIQDEIDLIWLYSGGVPVAYYDKVIDRIILGKDLTDKQKIHCGVFKKKIKNKEINL